MSEPLPQILLVEDSVEETLLLKTLLAEGGAPYQVTAVQDGITGVEMVTSREWSLVIIDLHLPGKDGIDVIQKARKAHPDLPIIATTGSTNDLLIDQAFRSGADYLIQKPMDRDEMLGKIREFVPIAVEADTTEAAAPSGLTVVAVGARPGDVEMGCGGILFKHRVEGHNVVIVNLAAGGDSRSRLLAAAARAAATLEAKITNLGGPDEEAIEVDEAREALEGVMARSAPGILYVPTASDSRASAAEAQRIALAAFDSVPNVLAYQGPTATLDFSPRFFVDIAPFLAKKLELISVYADLDLANVAPDLAEATARFWGRFMDPVQAEPLEVIRKGGG